MGKARFLYMGLVLLVFMLILAVFALSAGSCESDCTYYYDNIVHAACDGQNSCQFFDSISKSACDFSQPGWIRDYDSSNYVVCAGGAPQLKAVYEASIACDKEDIVKSTRIANYKGKPVKLVVAVCG